MTQSSLDPVEGAIAAIARGEMVVVVDDDDRENEGDLIAAAAKITPEQMAFMIRHTSGIVCAPITGEDARRLKLDPMVAHNDAPLGTAFTVSVDYREGLTTGISAKERAATVHALANGNVQASDFVRPGHIFPLIAKSGGVLMRSGHTEAAVDLARLAGLHPAGVISELVNDDGTVKRGPQVLDFARQHGLTIISVAHLARTGMARYRAWRPDPPRSRHQIDPPHRDRRASLCRPLRLRNRDRRDGQDRRLISAICRSGVAWNARYGTIITIVAESRRLN